MAENDADAGTSFAAVEGQCRTGSSDLFMAGDVFGADMLPVIWHA